MKLSIPFVRIIANVTLRFNTAGDNFPKLLIPSPNFRPEAKGVRKHVMFSVHGG